MSETSGVAAPEEPTARELVQPIVLLVDRDEPAGRDEGIAVAALASVKAYRQDPGNPVWTLWAAGAFAKSVRRADAKMFAKVLASFPDHALAAVGAARAVGLPPMPAERLPKLLAKLQVSGTQLPEGVPLAPQPLTIVLNDSLGMSTGKAAAQAAHALFAWLLDAGPAADAWAAAGFPVGVARLSARDFRKGARKATGPVIHDAGRTEIEPGSATAYVVLTAI
ncbi:peptidyl-tRNA hydrolase [Arthrobacter sp.]|uniref:peptidyl-tRNA hydrolase n=1 Tax=Arthrobacter sp. TaxID=1667 RepID=UPI0025908AF0|nr:peptidyl-tRNA hydrolase [Arthrobacter sp.]